MQKLLLTLLLAGRACGHLRGAAPAGRELRIFLNERVAGPRGQRDGVGPDNKSARAEAREAAPAGPEENYSKTPGAGPRGRRILPRGRFPIRRDGRGRAGSVHLFCGGGLFDMLLLRELRRAAVGAAELSSWKGAAEASVR